LETKFREQARKDVLEALGKAEKLKKPHVSEMFKDVYDEMPWNLQEQQAQLEELVKEHPDAFPLKNHISF
jgi:2-oxoisovalerate dehydrogenase E1 component alpha subunit